MSNNVKSLRTKLGLTQRQLAELVGTSQQQIQRIEAGRVEARLELATKLSEALGKSMNVVFPGAANAIAAFKKSSTSPKYAPGEKEFALIRKAGIEADPRHWTLVVRLRGHDEAMQFDISSADHDRLFRAVQDEQTDTDYVSCIVFETPTHCVAINLSELVCCQFLYDLGNLEQSPDQDLETNAEVFFRGSSSAVRFNVDQDHGSPDDEDDEGDFRNIFYSLDSGATEPSRRLHFADEDGESVFLRAGDIALLKVPLWVIDPAVSILDDDEDDPIAAPASELKH